MVQNCAQNDNTTARDDRVFGGYGDYDSVTAEAVEEGGGVHGKDKMSFFRVSLSMFVSA